MSEKKDRGRFSIKFNENDPAHNTVIEILERQGPRQKAQYIVNAILSYTGCRQMPEMLSGQTIDRELIKSVVQEILNARDLEKRKTSGTDKNSFEENKISDKKIENEKALYLISETMSAFRNL